jgi:hypothetical protein
VPIRRFRSRYALTSPTVIHVAPLQGDDARVGVHKRKNGAGDCGKSTFRATIHRVGVHKAGSRYPPVPLALRAHFTDGYSHYAPSGRRYTASASTKPEAVIRRFRSRYALTSPTVSHITPLQGDDARVGVHKRKNGAGDCGKSTFRATMHASASTKPEAVIRRFRSRYALTSPTVMERLSLRSVHVAPLQGCCRRHPH